MFAKPFPHLGERLFTFEMPFPFLGKRLFTFEMPFPFLGDSLFMFESPFPGWGNAVSPRYAFPRLRERNSTFAKVIKRS